MYANMYVYVYVCRMYEYVHSASQKKRDKILGKKKKLKIILYENHSNGLLESLYTCQVSYFNC
jgi:hypothetical protein